jgi:hypothetical protein
MTDLTSTRDGSVMDQRDPASIGAAHTTVAEATPAVNPAQHAPPSDNLARQSGRAPDATSGAPSASKAA